MRKALAAAALIALLAASPGRAQTLPFPAPSPPAPLDAPGRQAVIGGIAAALRNLYVFPEVGERAAAVVEAQAKAGAYDDLRDPRAFADRLTGDLASVAHDKHLRVMVPGGPPPEGRAPPPRAEAGVVRADLLTSAGTFSGGEGFAYDVKTHQLGVLVGETTGGGANPGGVVTLPDGLGIFVPRGRSQSPVTGTNWEGVGVAPDLAVPAATALRVALQTLGDTSEATDIGALSKASLFQPRTVARSESEPALRQFVAGLSRGAPDYDGLGRHMSPGNVVHLPDLKASLDKLGTLKSLTFRGVGPAGADIYRATFAGGEAELRIALGNDGAVEAVSLRPLS